MAAARRGRGNGWTVGAPKMPAALCAPAAGGRRLHHALWSGGEARRAGTCPLSLPSPPLPAPARVRPRPRSPPPHLSCRRRRTRTAMPQGTLRQTPTCSTCRRRRFPPPPPGLSARGARGRRRDGPQAPRRVKSAFSSTGPGAGGGGRAFSSRAASRAPRREAPPPPSARAGRQGARLDAHRDGAALQARFLIAAPRRPACRPVRPTLR